jgi:hypothetical protein
MKRLTLIALLVLAAVSLVAGTTYEFRADTSGLQQMSIDGTVAVDGPNLKMTVSHGDGMMFKSGATVLSRDGGKTISVFDPAAKTYYEMRVEAMMSSLTDVLHNAMVKLTFDHPSVTVKEGGDGGTVEGFPTQRVLVDASITVNMEAMGQTMSSKMSMHSESWTTDKIDASAMNLFQQRGGLTGIEGLDKLIAAQTAGLKGRFPLKQVTTVHIIQNGHDLATTTTSTVSKVKQQALDAAAFAAPAGYSRVDNPMEAMKKLGR